MKLYPDFNCLDQQTCTLISLDSATTNKDYVPNSREKERKRKKKRLELYMHIRIYWCIFQQKADSFQKPEKRILLSLAPNKFLNHN